MAVTIVVEGAKELIAKLTTLEQMNRVRKAIADEGDNLVNKLTDYPRNAHGPNQAMRGSGEKAARIRRGFFYHLKHRTISIPYVRTDRLKGGWTNIASADGWTATVGNDPAIGYNSWVQGSAQTRGHANSGWLTIDKAKTENEAGIISRISAALEEEVNNVG